MRCLRIVLLVIHSFNSQRKFLVRLDNVIYPSPLQNGPPKNGFRSIEIYDDILENHILRKSHLMKVYKKWQKKKEEQNQKEN